MSAQLLKDDGPMTERPSKRQRLAPVSTTNPKPAAEALPDVTWSRCVELADAMELNRTPGPRPVHGIAQLYAKQQHYLALPSEQRPQSAQAVDAELRWLTAVLELAQASSGTNPLCLWSGWKTERAGVMLCHDPVGSILPLLVAADG